MAPNAEIAIMTYYNPLGSCPLSGLAPLADSVAMSEGFLKKPEGKDYQFIGPDLTEIKYFGEGVGIACRKKDKDLVELFNKAIDQIRADGTYKSIQDKYFDFNVYGD